MKNITDDNMRPHYYVMKYTNDGKKIEEIYLDKEEAMFHLYDMDKGVEYTEVLDQDNNVIARF